MTVDAQTTSPIMPAILVVIPVYNHAESLRRVACEALQQHAHLLVVDDGSTDMPLPDAFGSLPAAHPLYGLPLHFIRHARNIGKGAAILRAAAKAKELGMSHIVTIDADGQHHTQDLLLFFQAVHNHPEALFVGVRDFSTENVPFSSRFGRAFSNFWFKVQTSFLLSDTQCGFRVYPVCLFDYLTFTENRYSLEIEVLVKAAWAGFPIKDIPIRVYYPPKKERISHFKALQDNIRISFLNTRLTIRAIIPWPHKRYALAPEGTLSLLHPIQSLRQLLMQQATPMRLALAAALGMLLGTLPLPGLHSILILLFAGSLRLNPIMALGISQLCMPPLVPALCVEVGHYLLHGTLLTDISWQTLGYEVLDRVYEWVLGSLCLAPLFAVVAGILVFIPALGIQRTLARTSITPDIVSSAQEEKYDTQLVQ